MNISNNKWYNFFFFEGSRLIFTLVVLCLIVAAILGMHTPQLIADLGNHYSQDSLYKHTLYLLFVNFSVVYLNRVIYQLAVNKYVRLLIQNARLKTYSQWMNTSDVDSEKYPQGEIISRIMSDTEAIRDLITSGAFGVFIDLCFVVSCLVGFMSIDPFMGSIIGGAEILATALLFWGSQLMREMFMSLRNAQAQVNRVTANILGGIQQVYFMKHLNYAYSKSAKAFDVFLEKQHKANTMDAGYYALAESLYPLLLIVVILIFPYSGILKPAIIFAIIDLIQRSISPIKEISGKVANIQRALTGINRIQQFLGEVGELSAPPSLFERAKLIEFSVEIKNFSYRLRNSESLINRNSFSLQNISFSARPGDLVGIVGLSGSGKSTLLNVLSGNLLPDDANCFVRLMGVNGEYKIDYKNCDEYRYQISSVSQESHIFSESLIFNLTLKHNLSIDEINEFKKFWEMMLEKIPYLKLMNLTPDSKIHPEKLSLGEKQLLSGVRACYLKKPIVFFDEISSALDSDLELALRKCILMIQEFSLTIIVAHRIETIVQSNNILVLDNGRLISSGTHDELLKTTPIYQAFINELQKH